MRDIVRREGSGMIVAMHDLNLALRYTDKVLMLRDRGIYAYGKPEEVLTREAIHDVYGVESYILRCDRGLFILPYEPSDDIIVTD
jgi:iron complex transport system ATP-binding protein